MCRPVNCPERAEAAGRCAVLEWKEQEIVGGDGRSASSEASIIAFSRFTVLAVLEKI
jgi:hypothetical protein